MWLHLSSPPAYLHPASPSALLLSAHYTHTYLPFSFCPFLTNLSQILSPAVAIPTLPVSHSCFPRSYLPLPAPIAGPQPYTYSHPLFSHPLSLTPSAPFRPFFCLGLGPNPVPWDPCPHQHGLHQHGCLPIPLLCPRHQQKKRQISTLLAS